MKYAKTAVWLGRTSLCLGLVATATALHGGCTKEAPPEPVKVSPQLALTDTGEDDDEDGIYEGWLTVDDTHVLAFVDTWSGLWYAEYGTGDTVDNVISFSEVFQPTDDGNYELNLAYTGLRDFTEEEFDKVYSAVAYIQANVTPLDPMAGDSPFGPLDTTSPPDPPPDPTDTDAGVTPPPPPPGPTDMDAGVTPPPPPPDPGPSSTASSYPTPGPVPKIAKSSPAASSPAGTIKAKGIWRAGRSRTRAGGVTAQDFPQLAPAPPPLAQGAPLPTLPSTQAPTLPSTSTPTLQGGTATNQSNLSAAVVAALFANELGTNLIRTVFGPPPPPVSTNPGTTSVGGTVTSTGLRLTNEEMLALTAMASSRRAPYLGIDGQPLKTPRNAVWRWDNTLRQYVLINPPPAPPADAGGGDAGDGGADAGCTGGDGGVATWRNRCPDVPDNWQNGATFAACMAPFGAQYDPNRICVNQYIYPLLGIRVCPRDFAQGCITPRFFLGTLAAVHQIINCFILAPITTRNQCMAAAVIGWLTGSSSTSTHAADGGRP